jgi:hypothetical protein
MNFVCATDCLRSCFRKAEVLDLALLNQVLYGTSSVLDWHIWIDAVLIEQVDYIGFEALKRSLGDLLNVFRTTVQGAPTRSGQSLLRALCEVGHAPVG